ncbi:MAG: DUF3391 domain-containing protein [Herminiimonas sp.]|nr:DUF3391 domain-containing protein [Herminiimonas sp.]
MSEPAPASRLKTAIRMPATQLQIGLFVSDLDCGWQGTPFLLEGLLLSSKDEIALIQSLSPRVTVDPTRSEIDRFPAVYLETIYEPAVAPVKKAGAPRQVEQDMVIAESSGGARAWLQQFLEGIDALLSSVRRGASGKVQPVDPSRAAGLQMAASTGVTSSEKAQLFPRYLDAVYVADAAPAKSIWRQRLAAWFDEMRRSLNPDTAKPRAVAPIERPDFIPDNFDLVRYPDSEPTIPGIPKALAACEMSVQALIRIARDIRTNGTIDMGSLQSAADTLAENMISRPATMLLAARMRDENDRIYQHGLGVAIYLTMLGRYLGFQREPLAELATIGMLLDLGKMDLDQELLDKPGALDAEEQKVMQAHVDIGVGKLRAGGVRSELVLRAIADHHERVDGLGYPNGRSSDDLTIYGKMAAIADGFVAMVGPRPYAPTMSTYEALRALFAEAGTRWHAPLVEQFVQSIGVFPVGSLIELASGEIAIVVEDNRFRRLEPKILVLTDRDKKQIKEPWSMDMMQHNFSIAPESVRILNGLPDGAHGVNFREYYLRRR